MHGTRSYFRQDPTPTLVQCEHGVTATVDQLGLSNEQYFDSLFHLRSKLERIRSNKYSTANSASRVQTLRQQLDQYIWNYALDHSSVLPDLTKESESHARDMAIAQPPAVHDHIMEAELYKRPQPKRYRNVKPALKFTRNQENRLQQRDHVRRKGKENNVYQSPRHNNTPGEEWLRRRVEGFSDDGRGQNELLEEHENNQNWRVDKWLNRQISEDPAYRLLDALGVAGWTQDDSANSWQSFQTAHEQDGADIV